MVQFAQFNGGVFGLGGAAAAENVNFFYLGGFKALVDVVCLLYTSDAADE